MPRTAALLAAAALLVSTASVHATMRITGDPGGLILDYVARFSQMRSSQEPVVIDGTCLSACTLVLAMLPRDRVCATSRAVLGFHAAWRPTSRGGAASSAVATQAMMELYPADIRSWIARHGGLTQRMVYLRGADLHGMVPACGVSANAVATASRADAATGRNAYASAARAGLAGQKKSLATAR